MVIDILPDSYGPTALWVYDMLQSRHHVRDRPERYAMGFDFRRAEPLSSVSEGTRPGRQGPREPTPSLKPNKSLLMTNLAMIDAVDALIRRIRP
jgi:hypothetical protein